MQAKINEEGARPWRVGIRSVATGGLIIAAEIIHGVLRAIMLVPLVGEFRSNQIGVFSGSAIIFVIAYLTLHWIGATRRFETWMVGAIWLGLIFVFEVFFGRFVVGLTWERIAADYDLSRGGLMPLGLMVLFLSPALVAKSSKPAQRSEPPQTGKRVS